MKKRKYLFLAIGLLSYTVIVYFGTWPVWIAVLALNYTHYEITDGYTKKPKGL